MLPASVVIDLIKRVESVFDFVHIPFPLVFLVSPSNSDRLQIAVGLASRFPKISVCASTANLPLVRLQSGRVTTSAQLAITQWLGSPNGTAEAFVFLQPLEAGESRNARVSSLDLQLSGCPDNARVNGLNSLFANTHAPDEAGSRGAGL